MKNYGEVIKTYGEHLGKKFSDYAALFDDTGRAWTKNKEYNVTFVRHQERYFNDLLQVRGYVFLNEVCEALGVRKTKAGQVSGWDYKNGNYIKIDITMMDDSNDLILDFNPDGFILDSVFE